ncbi:uncharacterized protein LOC130381387 isoform X1 [Gadus chalcogrammus]|uniref:uncharacterized protein LOC130381387 isoform X1 n=1 Tax=Gadus chalcogrammus TaxID=1042646 RepID=UPI0024C3FDE3|nr:uncharacterized protein LOC130381387 isoform X1 [Gadus chalcogrammus]
MSFLTIPSEDGLFTTVKAGKSAEDGDSSTTCPADDDDEEEDDDEDDGSEEVNFIPRCSPIPRKRGQSIFDEADEYMRIQLSLPAARRRVAFADTTGGDLVDVREFVAFDSDEEEDPRYEAEAAHAREPTYRIHTEFHVATRSALAEAVQTHKVEVEMLSPIENEPLAFSGIVRVLNISYHKAVYIRSTMDHWATYFDHPAEYIQESSDGETDAFCFKLSFASPYDTHGSSIEFVVRYETSDGDFWANNSQLNYVVTLLVSYEDNLTPVNTDTKQELRGILKASKFYSMDNDGQHMDEEDLSTSSQPQHVGPKPVCPVIIHPEIDLETADDTFGAPRSPNQELQSLDDAQCDEASMPHQSPYMSCRNTTDQPLHVLSPVHTAPQSSESPSLPSVPCESVNQISERLVEAISWSALQNDPTPFQPHTPSSSTSSLAADEEQGKDSFALDKLIPFTVTQSPIMEASSHLSSEDEEVEMLTLGDGKVKLAQTFSRGEIDLFDEKVKHLDSESDECTSESSPRNEITPDNVEGKWRFCETEEETLQTAPLESLNNAGVPDVPSTPNTQLPLASEMLTEQPPSKVQHLDLLEISMTTKVENTYAGKAHSCLLTQLELLSVERETEQERGETQAVLMSHSDDPYDKEQNTKVDEEEATPGDAAALLEEDEKVQQETLSSDIGQTNGEQSSMYQSTNTDNPFELGTSVKNNLLYPSDSEATATQTSLVDPDTIFRDAFDNLRETSQRPEEESIDLVSPDTCLTPPAPESPPRYGSSPSIGSSELSTTPSVDSIATSPLCVPKAESQVFLGEERQAATSNAVADTNTSATSDVNVCDATQGGKEVVEPPQTPSDSSAAYPPYTSLTAEEPLTSHPMCKVGKNLRLSITFLWGVTCISVVMADPSSLFIVGLVLSALFFLIASD